MHITLRDYQDDGIASIYHKWRTNKRIILWAQMGSGKSEMAAYIANDAMKDGMPVVMVVRGRELVKNLSQRLDKYKIDHSVFMAGHHRIDKSKLIQICSLDTMISRNAFPFSDRDCILIADESHKDYKVLFKNYPHQYHLGLTATPFSDMSDYDDYTQPIEPFELRDQGVLVPDRIYCPHVIDTSSLKMVAGDFKRDQVEKLVTDGGIVGDVIQDYIDLGQNRPAVCFGVTIEHSKQLRDAFLKAGISAIHCDAKSDEEERNKAKKGLENGTIKVVCNVDIFSVGWDCPIVSCIILARPTWSLIWYLQAVGRGLRSFPGKKDCIILDNAGNVYRHGTPYRPREISLEKPEKKKKKEKGEIQVRTCGDCMSVYELPAPSCPFCGYINPIREVKRIDGILSEYTESDQESKTRRIKEAQSHYYKLQWIARQKKLPDTWIRDQILKKYGSDTLPYIDHLFKIRRQ